MDIREAFDAVMADLEFSMFIVTARAGDEPLGCLVGFATQASIDPPRFLVCLSRLNHTYRVACGTDVLAVHLVGAEQTGLAELFGGETGDEVDKFARCAWRPGPDGVPLIEALPDWFAGRVVDRVDLGDHVGFVLEPIDGQAGRGPQLLTFHRARRIEAGHPA